jgi:hypothetical protein
MGYATGEGGDAPKEAFHVDASHIDTSHTGVVGVSDADLLFRGDFQRLGPDLHLNSHDGRHLAIHGYFDSEHPATLVAPNGAHLPPDVVHLLAGPGQYAEAKSQTAVGVLPDVVGRVEKIAGDASVVRNGVAVELHLGDAVYKGDIVQTGGNGSLGIAFADGTALNLAANTRMAISEYSYDANSTSNAALFTAIEGTFAFVAGKLAHTGDMKIATPVAVMAIHGTTGWSHQLSADEIRALKVLTITSNLGEVVWSFAVTDDDGVHTHGVYDLLRRGVSAASVGEPGYLWYLDMDGNLSSRQMSDSELTGEQGLLQQFFQWLSVLPASIGIHDSAGIPDSSLPSATVFHDQPVPLLVQFGLGGGTPGFPQFPNLTPFLPQQPPASTIFIWNSTGRGSWSQQLASWNQGFAPNSPVDTVFIETGNSNYDINGSTTVTFLTIDAGATLGITLGQLLTHGFDDNGTLIIGGDPPTFVVDGPTGIGSTGAVTVEQAGSEGLFNGSVVNFGVMTARLGGELLFEGVVANDGKMVSRGAGSVVAFSTDGVDNSGEMLATHHGTMTLVDASLINESGAKVEARRHGIIDFDSAGVTNRSGGLIDAFGRGSRINFTDSSFDNSGIAGAVFGGKMLVENTTITNEARGLFVALAGGQVVFDDSSVTNDHRASMLAAGHDAGITFSDSTLDNSGHVAAEFGGKVEFRNGGAVTNETGALIEAKDFGAITFESGRGEVLTVTNDRGARVEAEDYSFVGFDDVALTNDRGALIEARDFGTVEFVETRHAKTAITNHGTIEAKDGGIVEFIDVGGDRNKAVTNTGLIEALQFGTVVFDDSKVDNAHGDIAAFGWDSTIELDGSLISKGRLETGWGGLIETGYRSGTSILDDVTIERGSDVRISGRSTLVFSDNTIMHGGHLAIDYFGTLEIEGSDVLENVDVHNDGLIQVDYPNKWSATLTLEAGTEITGGFLSIGKSGEVDIERGFNGQGATLNDVYVENDGLIQVDSPRAKTTTLTLEGGTEISGGTLNIGSDGVVDVEYGSNTHSHGAIFDGVTVDNKDGGTFEVGETNPGRGHTVIAVLEAGTTVTGGKLSIGRSGELEIERGFNGRGATLDGVDVENDGLIQVDFPQPKTTTLTLEGGTEINGGTLDVGRDGIVDVEYGSNGHSHGATFDDVDIDMTDGGTLEVGETNPGRGHTVIAVLEAGTTVTGGTLSIGRSGELDIERGFNGQGATLDGVDVENDGLIQVDFPQPTTTTLTLEGGTEINGGTLDIGRDGIVDVEYGTNGHSHGAIFDGVTIDIEDGGTLEVGETKVPHPKTVIALLEDGTTVNGGDLLIGHAGVVDVEYGSTGHSHGATFDGVTVDNGNGGTFEVGETNPGRGHTAIALLDDGTEIDGGTLTIGAFGTVDVEYGSNGHSHGAAFDDVAIDDTAGGMLEVGETNPGHGHTVIAVLEDGSTVTGGTLKIGKSGELDIESGAIGLGATLDGVDVENDGLIQVDFPVPAPPTTLTLVGGTTIDGGTLDIGGDGVVDVEYGTTGSTHGAIFDGVTISDGGTLEVGVINESNGKIAVALLQDGTTVNGGGLAIGQWGTLDVEYGSAGPSHGATFDGVTINNRDGGTFEVGKTNPGNSHSAVALLDDGTTVDGGKLTIAAFGTVDVEYGANGPSHGATFDGVTMDNTAGGTFEVGETLGSGTAIAVLDDDATFTGGTLTVGTHGELDIETGTDGSGHGATLDGVTVTDDGSVVVGANAKLQIGGTVTLKGGGTVSMASGSEITDSGSAATLDNVATTISGQGTIGGGHLTLTNEVGGTIDASVSGQTLMLDPGAAITNHGTLEATGGATLEIASDVNNDAVTGLIEATGTTSLHSTVQLDAVTVTDGKISIDANSTLAIENGTTHLNGVDVENAGNLRIDTPAATATLVLGTGTTIDGTITVGASGELDIDGASFNGATTINDSGIVDIDAPLTLDSDLTINLINNGTFSDTGVLTVAANGSATLSGADFGEVDIGTGATLTLDNANATTVDFTGTGGTLVLDTPSTFTGAITGLTAGDVIDLAGIAPSSVVLNGTALIVDGVTMPFTISGLPGGDSFAFKDDGHGGTDLKVVSGGLTVTTQPEEGTEGSAIPLSITDTVSGATVTSVLITGIPAGATVTDALGHTLTLQNGNLLGTTSLTLTPDQLAGLKITPPNDTNFTLTVLATATVSGNSGYEFTVQSSETITVDPLQPTVAWTAGSKVVGGTGSPLAIALTDGVGAETGANGDDSNSNGNGNSSNPGGPHNSITSVMISGIQVGATIRDGTNHFTATATDTSEDVTHWTLANLTITPASETNFKLTATVTESDSDSPAQTSTAQAQITIVTGTDWTAVAGGDWQTGADWDNGIPVANLGATIDSSIVHASSDYTVAVNGTADVAGVLTLNDAHATLDLKEGSALAIGGAVIVDHGTLNIEDNATMTAGGTFAVHGGMVDVFEGFDAVFSFDGEIPAIPGGVLTIGALVVDGGEVLIQPDTDTQPTPGGGPAGTLNATSINVETGGTVELHGYINVTGLIETTGGNLIVGPDVNFGDTSVNTYTVTFGGSSGTVTLIAGTSSGTMFSGPIAGFGPGDVIDLPDLVYGQNSFNYFPGSGGTGFLSYGAAGINLAGNYAPSDFVVESDGTPINGDPAETGSKIVWALSNVTMTFSENPETNLPFGTVQVTVTVTDPDGHAVQGVNVAPSFTSNAGQGAFTHTNSIFGDLSPELTNSQGIATFTFNAFGYAGNFDISALLNGVQTVSQQLVVEPMGASFRSSLTARLSFAGPQETAILTLTDLDSNFNPQPGDAVGWASDGAGAFSPAANAGVTDANGILIDTFTPTSDTAQTITATFGAGMQTESTTVDFVAMDTWINTSGGDWGVGGNWSGDAVPAMSHAAWIGDAGTYTVNVTANQSIFGLGTISTATLELKAGLSVTGYGDSVLAGALKIDAGGGEFLASHGQVDLNGAVTNNSTLQINGATVNVAGGIAGTGTINADGGHLNLQGTVAATQSITISGAAVVHVAQVEAGQVTFAGAGMLALDAAPAAGLLVSHFAAGDSIDLADLSLTANASFTLDATGKILTVGNGTTSETIHFSEAHAATDFTLRADPLGLGGIDVVDSNATLDWSALTGSVQIGGFTTQNFSIAGISNADIALIEGPSGSYLYFNGHSDGLGGHESSYGMNLGGINTAQTIVGLEPNLLDENPQILTETFDSSSGLTDEAPVNAVTLYGPQQLRENVADGAGIAMGINDSGLVVGYFLDTEAYAQELRGQYERLFDLKVPPHSDRDDNPYAQHEYGFIYNPATSSYLMVDVGSSAGVAALGAVQDNKPQVAYTVLTSINNAGIAVGYWTDYNSIQHAFIFNSNTHAFTYLPDMHFTGPPLQNYSTDTVLTGINDEGIAVGYYGYASNVGGAGVPLDPQFSDTHSFIWDTNTNTILNGLVSIPGVGDDIALTGINNDGLVTVDAAGQSHTDNLFLGTFQPVINIDDGGTYYDTSTSYQNIQFNGPTGQLVISPAGFKGQITGFNGTGASLSQSDAIDLTGINFVDHANFLTTYYAPSGQLWVNEQGVATYFLNFVSYTGNFAFTSDGHGGTLIFDPPSDGPATVSAGELLEVTANNSTVTFTDGTGAVQIDNPSVFTGHIAGFTGTAPDAAHSDLVDLAGVDFTSAGFSSTYHAAAGQLSVSDGTNNANLAFDNFNGTFNFASDGNGGTAITDAPAGSVGTTTAQGEFSFADADTHAAPVASVTAEGSNYVGTLSVGAVSASNGSASVQWSFDLAKDQINPAAGQTVTQSYNVVVTDAHNPTANTSQTVAVTFGGPGNDNFVFTPGVGADTIMNFDVQHDTIDLTHFSNVQSLAQLSSMITANAAGEAVIDLGNHDSITIAALTAAQLHQVLQSAVHLH